MKRTMNWTPDRPAVVAGLRPSMRARTLRRTAAGLGFAVVLVAASSAGAIVELIEITGDGMGNALMSPYNVAVHPASQRAYLTGFLSDTVFEILPGGTINKIMDSTGDGAGNALTGPFDVAVGADGKVYVSGFVSNNVFQFDPGGMPGSMVTEIVDETGAGAGQSLLGPRGVAVDGMGNVYVVGESSHNVLQIEPGGTVNELMDITGDETGNGLSSPVDVAVDSAGRIYVTGHFSDNAFRIDLGLQTKTQIIDALGAGGNRDLSRPWGIAVTPSGDTIYVSGLTSDNVFRITSGGSISEVIDATGDGTHPLTSPTGVAVTSNGDVLVTGLSSDNAFRVRESDLQAFQVIDASGDGFGNVLFSPWGIASDPKGNFYITGLGSDNLFGTEQVIPALSPAALALGFGLMLAASLRGIARRRA